MYGPIFRMQLGAQTVIVLGTYQAARDLLDKRWKIYSDRPELIVCAKHLSGGTSLLFFFCVGRFYLYHIHHGY